MRLRCEKSVQYCPLRSAQTEEGLPNRRSVAVD
jgi:hypothetical protein